MGGRGARMGSRYKSYILKEIPGAKMVYPVKSEIGYVRSSVKISVNEQFKDVSYNKKMKSNTGKTISIEVGTDSKCRSHLAHDIVDYKMMDPADADKLKSYFKNSSYVGHGPAKHEKNGYEHFYYFKVRNKDLYFNVGKKIAENGTVQYRLYSLSRKI